MDLFERTARRLESSRRATAEMGTALLWVVVPQSEPDRVLVRGPDRELCLRCQEGESVEDLVGRAQRLCDLLNVTGM